jgi:hypothetical protein
MKRTASESESNPESFQDPANSAISYTHYGTFSRLSDIIQDPASSMACDVLVRFSSLVEVPENVDFFRER